MGEGGGMSTVHNSSIFTPIEIDNAPMEKLELSSCPPSVPGWIQLKNITIVPQIQLELTKIHENKY
jgi:hypothetical protein